MPGQKHMIYVSDAAIEIGTIKKRLGTSNLAESRCVLREPD
ncbi:hypothetical protein [Mariniblastus fucicola]|nr:hypothetical protein [Mariniblastus fucicola]